ALDAEAAAAEPAAEAAEEDAERDHHPRHVDGLEDREALAAQEVDVVDARAEEAAVPDEPALPELRPREAVALGGPAHARRGVPDPLDLRALRDGDLPADLRGVRAEVHVVHEVAVHEDVEDARAGDAGDER